MHIPTSFTLSGVVSLGVRRWLGLRLRGVCQFQAFLASSLCAALGSSYGFRRFAPPPWRRAFSWVVLVFKSGRSLLVFGSNPSVKPTCLRQAAYLSR